MLVLPFAGGGGSFTGGTVPDATTFSSNVIISGTLDVTGVATFTTTVTGSGDIYAGAAFDIGFTGRSKFKSSADSNITLLNAAEADFGLLMFGGTSSAFPAIKRAGTGLEVKLADDSNFAALRITTLRTAVGTAAAPALNLDGNAGGIYESSAGIPSISSSGAETCRFLTTGPRLGALGLQFGSNFSATDVYVFRGAAGVLAIGNNSSTSAGGLRPAQSANGATVEILGISELLTLSTSGTTTDTTANLLPAGAIIKTVVARVTTTITTATDWQVGDPTTAGRFTTANATMTAGTTDIGRIHMTTGIASATTGIYQSAAAKVRITTTGTPGAGAIRLTAFYELLTPPTS